MILLGKLFASPTASYGEQHTKNFDEFLNRFGAVDQAFLSGNCLVRNVDKSAIIREFYCKCACKIWSRHPKILGPKIQKKMMRMIEVNFRSGIQLCNNVKDHYF